MARINVYAENNGYPKLAGYFDDTKTTVCLSSTVCCSGSEGHSSEELTGPHENLLRTAKGRWVVNVWYYDHRGDVPAEGDEYHFISDDEAKTWLVVNHYDKEYAEHFGPMAEEVGPGRPKIGGEALPKLGDVLPRLDTWAAHHGITRAEAARLLLDRGMNAEPIPVPAAA